MTPGAFVAKWRASKLKESSAAQEHFIDLCRLLGEPTPGEGDPTGDYYCFERGARKDTGGDGWADVWKRHHFAWEYKGQRADLDAALSAANARHDFHRYDGAGHGFQDFVNSERCREERTKDARAKIRMFLAENSG